MKTLILLVLIFLSQNKMISFLLAEWIERLVQALPLTPCTVCKSDRVVKVFSKTNLEDCVSSRVVHYSITTTFSPPAKLLHCGGHTPASGSKLLHQAVINHGQRCGKQQAQAVLVQLCPPCLPVKGSVAVHWKKINVRKVSASKQHYSPGRVAVCPHSRKTNAARAKGSSPATSTIQQHRKIYAHNTVCL